MCARPRGDVSGRERSSRPPFDTMGFLVVCVGSVVRFRIGRDMNAAAVSERETRADRP
jgi:hypothetical protein